MDRTTAVVLVTLFVIATAMAFILGVLIGGPLLLQLR